jgi:uncharacterized protein YdcH (DUF465 family)
MENSNIERLNSKLMALYNEREDLEQEIELAETMNRATEHLEEVMYDLNHSIKELETQLHNHEVEHLEQMKEAI